MKSFAGLKRRAPAASCSNDLLRNVFANPYSLQVEPAHQNDFIVGLFLRQRSKLPTNRGELGFEIGGRFSLLTESLDILLASQLSGEDHLERHDPI